MGTSLTAILLSFISILDYYGAQEWALGSVAIMSAVIFLSIRFLLGKKYDVDWDALVHAVLTAILSCMCQYLNYYSAIEMRGEPEPYGTIAKCMGPLTSLHRIVPSITLGYAICDIINGFTLSIDAVAHGFATFTVMASFIYLDASPLITPMLVMEVSTSILAFLRAKFLTPFQRILLQVMFAVTFFLTRILLTPYVMYEGLAVMYYFQGDCIHPALFWVTLLFSTFFIILNLFWFYKLLKKIERKLSGKESMTDVERKVE